MASELLTWGYVRLAAAKAMESLTGVVDHGLFLDMVDVCIIARADGVELQEK